jgi:hypothetical protein
LQTVRKPGLSGFLRGVGDVRIAHASHLGIGRDQLLLLPDAVDDYVVAENPVRFIDVFVAGWTRGGGVRASCHDGGDRVADRPRRHQLRLNPSPRHRLRLQRERLRER